MSNRVIQQFEESARIKVEFAGQVADQVTVAVDKIVEAFRHGHKLLLFGNGGSACDASHLAAEFVGRFSSARERRGLPALALTTDQAIITSLSNDYQYDVVFARQIETLGEPGDIAIAISTSGNSPNVLRGVEAAKGRGLLTIGFTGASGTLAKIVDLPFSVPSSTTARIQEAHITLGHVFCELVENQLFGELP